MAYSKYNNKKTKVGIHLFDSKKEAKRYADLLLLERAKEISYLRLQPKFLLQDGFEYKGKKIRAIYYIADFQYRRNGEKVVEDVKGMKTDVYKLKKKLFLARNPDIDFMEI